MATTTTTRRRKPAIKADSKLLASVPEMVIYEEYRSRSFSSVLDIDMFRYAKESSKNVLLSGDTGAGKSHAVRAYCAKDKLRLVIIPCNGAIEPSQLFGMPLPNESGGVYFQESGLVDVVRNGGVAFFDEVNFMPPRVAAALHQLLRERILIMLEKGGEIIHAHPDFQVVASYNEDYEGTRPLNEAFKNRFALKLRFPYDPEVEQQLVCMPVMLDLAQRLRAAYRANDLETPISTNMLVEFEEHALDISYEFAVENFLNGFHDHERTAVRDTVELFSSTIQEQLKEMEDDA